jgi:hypothetical protein
VESGRVDYIQGRDRRVAVVVTADGRRVTMALRELDRPDGSLLGLVRSLLAGLEGLLGLLIAGSRREDGGSRREERR